MSLEFSNLNLKNCHRILKGSCSAFQWLRMLKRPRLGRKKTTMAIILLPAANVLQSRITSWEVNGKKTFSVFIAFFCNKTQVLKLQHVKRTNTVLSVCSKKASSPLVVGVFDKLRRTRINWRDIWKMSSKPKSTFSNLDSFFLTSFFLFTKYINNTEKESYMEWRHSIWFGYNQFQLVRSGFSCKALWKSICCKRWQNYSKFCSTVTMKLSLVLIISLHRK